ncbi:uncharacterized protein [Primulina eburnea]|uniref:uncharacterized protein n=1 Tax=Primulina eburnea TaxID=1245227 RepID=UPI003C6C829F
MKRLSIGTVPNNTILYDPPIQQAELLKQWLQTNKEYIEIVVSQKLYDKANQEIDQPFESQIRKSSQILSLNEVAELFDGTGNLHAYVEHKEESMLLCMSGEDVIEAKEKKMPFCPNIFNQKLRESQFLFQLRTSWNKTRGKSFVRNTIIAYLPASESSSTSHNYEDKCSTFKGEGFLRENVAVSESQESRSAMQEEHFEIELKTHHASITGKRRLECREKVLSESLKHVKQD